MNAQFRRPVHPPVQTIWLVVNLRRLDDTCAFSTEEEAYDHWLECQDHVPFSVNFPEGSMYPLDLDFEDRREGEAIAARADRAHEETFKVGRM